MSFEWSYDLTTRIKWIDEQHKEMFEKANLLVAAFNAGKGKEEILETMRFLGDYVVIHFRQEEELQIKYNYPYYLAHKDMHDKFMLDFKKLKEQLTDYGASSFLVFEVKERLLGWIRNHIYLVDKAMADYLLQNTDITDIKNI